MFFEMLHNIMVGVGFDLTEYWQYAVCVLLVLIWLKR